MTQSGLIPGPRIGMNRALANGAINHGQHFRKHVPGRIHLTSVYGFAKQLYTGSHASTIHLVDHALAHVTVMLLDGRLMIGHENPPNKMQYTGNDGHCQCLHVSRFQPQG